ncbi:MAG: type II toxin-antitoxin system HicA family toxin [Chloroflexota bacterium]|nr:type II toxin-antitoxin system HicA family toxin [Chloroflexota bacterium]
MPVYGPISRRELITTLRRLGWDGPYTGSGKHPQYMTKGNRQLRLPNPHRGDIGVHLLGRILSQAGISRDEWEQA